MKQFLIKAPAGGCWAVLMAESSSEHHLTVRGLCLKTSCTSARTSPPRPGPWCSAGVPTGCIRPTVPSDWSPWWRDPRGRSQTSWTLRGDARSGLTSPGPRSPARERRRSPSGGSWCGGCAYVEAEWQASLWPVSLWTSPESRGALWSIKW